MIPVWLCNFFVAWHLAKATKALGKSPLIYGFFPRLAHPFLRLHSLTYTWSTEHARPSASSKRRHFCAGVRLSEIIDA
jgi:hypothetical protein